MLFIFLIAKQVSTSRQTANYTNAKTQRKKPRAVLQDITNISSSFLNINEDSSNQTFEATIDGSLTDVSEDDEMSAAYDSDYGGSYVVLPMFSFIEDQLLS